MDSFHIISWVVLSFFIGSVPFGFLFVLLKGKGDIRNFGSGNIGATNVARAGGSRLGIATLVCDLGKGALAVYLVQLWGLPDLIFAAAFSSVLGHIFTPWLKFEGGKGVATLCGSLAVASPKLLFLVLLIFIGCFLSTRIVSLASIAATLSLPLFSLIFWNLTDTNFWLITLLSTIVVLKHRTNITRLLNNEEPTFHF